MTWAMPQVEYVVDASTYACRKRSSCTSGAAISPLSRGHLTGDMVYALCAREFSNLTVITPRALLFASSVRVKLRPDAAILDSGRGISFPLTIRWLDTANR